MSTVNRLIPLHSQHLVELLKQVLDALKALSPASFEVYAKCLLRGFGWEDLVVSKLFRDGGMHGHGREPLGHTDISVTFRELRIDELALDMVGDGYQQSALD